MFISIRYNFVRDVKDQLHSIYLTFTSIINIHSLLINSQITVNFNIYI